MVELEKRIYILYDLPDDDYLGTNGRALLAAFEDLEESKRHRKEFSPCACFSYADDGKTLTDERFEWA